MPTILLAKVLGIFLAIVGSIVVLRRHEYIGIFGGFVRERMLRVVTGVIVLLAGLFLIVQHQSWSSPPAAIITLLGWVATFEAVAYLALPDPLLERVLQAVNRPAVYIFWGLIAIAVGLYLAGYGFGYFAA